jgi:hypothetical protein
MSTVIPKIVASQIYGPQVGAISSTVVYTPPSDATLRLSLLISPATANSDDATVYLSWTDDQSISHSAGITAAFNAGDATQQRMELIARVKGGTDVSVVATESGGLGGVTSYTVRVIVEEF